MIVDRGEAPTAGNVRVARAHRPSKRRVSLDEVREVDLEARARTRLTEDIPYTDAILGAEYESAAADLVTTCHAVAAAIERLNETYIDRDLLRLEALALAQRFVLPGLCLPLCPSPARLETIRDALFAVRTAVLRDRVHRSAREEARRVADTPGGRLIVEAGPTEAKGREAEPQSQLPTRPTLLRGLGPA